MVIEQTIHSPEANILVLFNAKNSLDLEKKFDFYTLKRQNTLDNCRYLLYML